MKLKIEHVERRIEEKEIELPYFSKSTISFFKVISEKEFIKVDTTMYPSITRFVNSELIKSFPFDDDCVQIEQGEYEETFQRVLTKICE